MRLLSILLLYAGLMTGANAALADAGKLAALAEGDLAKITFSVEPAPVPAVEFTDETGTTKTLAEYRGRHILLNFWALWCAPCVEEMPYLNDLDAAFEGQNFEVVTITTGRNSRPRVDAFFEEAQLTSLPKLFDPKMEMAQQFGARGLPISVLIDPEGREVGRALGDVVWNSDAAKKLIATWIAGPS